jgi:hypothetical protein
MRGSTRSLASWRKSFTSSRGTVMPVRLVPTVTVYPTDYLSSPFPNLGRFNVLANRGVRVQTDRPAPPLTPPGEGFHGTGHHLSGFKVPEHVGKAKGLAAAEKRLATQRKIGKGGVLGGSGTGGKTMKEVIAEVSVAAVSFAPPGCRQQSGGCTVFGRLMCSADNIRRPRRDGYAMIKRATPRTRDMRRRWKRRSARRRRRAKAWTRRICRVRMAGE